jgi:hypothetical protein
MAVSVVDEGAVELAEASGFSQHRVDDLAGGASIRLVVVSGATVGVKLQTS